jgi:hypothetical protein
MLADTLRSLTNSYVRRCVLIELMFPPTNQLPKCAARAGLVMVTAPTTQTAVAVAHTTMKADRQAAERVRSGRCGRSGSGAETLRAALRV